MSSFRSSTKENQDRSPTRRRASSLSSRFRFPFQRMIRSRVYINLASLTEPLILSFYDDIPSTLAQLRSRCSRMGCVPRPKYESSIPAPKEASFTTARLTKSQSTRRIRYALFASIIYSITSRPEKTRQSDENCSSSRLINPLSLFVAFPRRPLSSIYPPLSSLSSRYFPNRYRMECRFL